MSEPKILIMVLTSMQEPYFELMKAQYETWDAVNEEGVETLYYSGGHDHDKVLFLKEKLKDGFVSMNMQFSIRDDYYYMAGKFKLALERAGVHLYDYIFRTNSSSYVNKKRLKEFAATLPKEKLYAGWTMTDSEDHGGKVVSGAGIFLSRDTAEILRENIDINFEMEEDIYCGRILRKHGIEAIDDKSRLDWPFPVSGEEIRSAYHLRFKTGNRIADANNMWMVHQKIISNG